MPHRSACQSGLTLIRNGDGTRKRAGGSQANVNQSVEVTWPDGSNQTVTVIRVDDEGFVYDLVPKDPKTEFGQASTRFQKLLH